MVPKVLREKLKLLNVTHFRVVTPPSLTEIITHASLTLTPHSSSDKWCQCPQITVLCHVSARAGTAEFPWNVFNHSSPDYMCFKPHLFWNAFSGFTKMPLHVSLTAACAFLYHKLLNYKQWSKGLSPHFHSRISQEAGAMLYLRLDL